jgi:hypothetical protein
MRFPNHRSILALGLAGTLFATSVGSAFADPRDFTVVNNTSGVVIAHLYVAPTDSNSWEEDVLGKDVLGPGESWKITFSKFDGDGGKCLYDVKAIAKEGQESVLYKLNLCETNTFTYNDPLAVQSFALLKDDGSGKPGAPVSAFKSTDRRLFAMAQLSRVVTDFKGKASWVAVETTAGNNITVSEVDLSAPMADTITTSVELPQDWPTGKYRLDLFSNGTLISSQPFDIAS